LFEIETPVLYFKLVIALSFGMTIEYGIHMQQFVRSTINKYRTRCCYRKSPKRCLETYCFCSISYYYYYSPFFLCDMHVSTADLRTEFHETWWSFSFVV